jgi:site-specific DNA-methyltransferase (adenine-specific)
LNTLYYGDNLTVLRNQIERESVDLIYLDPPFNSQASYNVLFRSTSGERSHAQIEAFEDTWHWGQQAESAFDEVVHSWSTDTVELLRALRAFLKENDMMAYLCMMAVRLLELHRVLKPTGSLYLHCDPTASHYLKIVLDSLFGPENYRSEIVWLRSRNPKGSQHKNIQWGGSTDTILFYSKSGEAALHLDRAKAISDADDIARHFPNVDDRGRWDDGPILRSDSMGARPNLVYEYKGFTPGPAGWRMSREKLQEIDRMGNLYWTATNRPRRKLRPGEKELNPIGNCWIDIPPINSQAQERLGYPTQNPQALLERIIAASSNEGDIVLDPFCGCGTTIHAAQKLKRQWIGIDLTHLAISLIEKRLNDAFPGIKYEVHGTPKDLDGARALATQDKYQFQWWAVSLVNAVPFGGKKKGADSGIDGLIYFKPEGKTTEKAIVSVKGGENVNVAMVRDLAHVVDREKAKIGVFITLADSTGPMRTEAVKVGFYETLYGKYPKIQILSIADLFGGKLPNIPLVDSAAFKKAPKEAEGGEQDELPF